MFDILMPQLGDGVTEGTITRWIKRIGESVTTEDTLFEVSTDKVDSEVPSPVSGVLTEILVSEGETVEVGTRLAMVSDQDSSPGAVNEPSSSSTPDVETLDAPSRVDVAVQRTTARGHTSSPLIRKLIEESRLEPHVISGTGVGGRITRTDVLAALQTHATRANQTFEGQDAPGRAYSPVVRRLLSRFGLDPNLIIGTGAGGRVTRSDVLVAAGMAESEQARRSDGTVDVHSESGEYPARPALHSTSRTDFNDDEVIPFTNIRRRTAEHMVRSKSTSPHTTVAIEVDFSNVERTRLRWKETHYETEGFSLTYLPFATMAAINAIRHFPQVNSSVGDDALVVHRSINVGIAVDLNFNGLLVPVVRRADELRLRALAREISALSVKARTKKLSTDDLSGGTFTITNAGPFGTLFTVPVINQPQVAILSTDGVKKKPVAIEMPDGSDGIAIHPVGNLTMSWDHRAFDGAYAAAFLKSVKDILETRNWEAEL